MLTKLIIPVINTENLNFKTNREYSTETLIRMEEQELLYKKNMVDDYFSGNINQNTQRNNVTQNDKTKYDFFKSDCLFLNIKKEDIKEDFFMELLETQKMFLMLINVNPNDMDNNAEEELRFWVDDSMRILNDNMIDNSAKLRVLPTKTFGIEINEKDYQLLNCKLIENHSDNKFPFNYIIMVEKITK